MRPRSRIRIAQTDSLVVSCLLLHGVRQVPNGPRWSALNRCGYTVGEDSSGLQTSAPNVYKGVVVPVGIHSVRKHSSHPDCNLKFLDLAGLRSLILNTFLSS